MRQTKGCFEILFCLAALTLAGACSTGSINDNDPEALFKEAQSDIESDRYQLALDKLKIVRSKFPYSSYSTLAQLRIADVYFMQESFIEAAHSYQTFRDLHPKHDQVAYAMFRVGESYEQDIPSKLARDLTSAYKALDAFGEFLQRFPNDPKSAEARNKVQEIRGRIAQKELYIAEFYEHWDEPGSAYGRYRKIEKVYPDTPVIQKAQKRREALENDKPEKEIPLRNR